MEVATIQVAHVVSAQACLAMSQDSLSWSLMARRHWKRNCQNRAEVVSHLGPAQCRSCPWWGCAPEAAVQNVQGMTFLQCHLARHLGSVVGSVQELAAPNLAVTLVEERQQSNPCLHEVELVVLAGGFDDQHGLHNHQCVELVFRHIVLQLQHEKECAEMELWCQRIAQPLRCAFEAKQAPRS